MTKQQRDYANRELKGLTGYEVYSKYKHLILGFNSNNKLFNTLMEAWREINKIKKIETKYVAEPRKIRIGEPIFQGKKEWREKYEPPFVGVAEDAMQGEKLRIEILYEDVNKNRLYPNEFTIDRKKAMTYPIDYKGSHTLRVIPIKDMEEVGTVDTLEETVKLFGYET